MLHLEQTPVQSYGIENCALALTPPRRQWLEQLDRDASALLSHLEQRPTHRLGIYFEQLWHFFLQEDPETELIAHNLPVHDTDRTIGEFDCLYYCRQRERHVHLELAVKYFLSLPAARATNAAATASDWVGPDNRDRLDLKLEQLLERQILLGDHPVSQQALRERGIATLSKEIALKGYLFQPLVTSERSPTPPGYNSDCKLSHWVRYDQLQSHCNSLASDTYSLLPKMQWLCPAHGDNLTVKMTQQKIELLAAHHFQHDNYPIMIAALDKSGSEASRFFVTPQTWPDNSSL